MSNLQEDSGEGISADEIALYDRQIRLWGVKAQEKLRSANILLVTFKALANEIAKNLVLAGVGSLTILDHEPVTEMDLGAQFFVSEETIGQNRAQAAAPQVRAMNPRVQLHIDTDDVRAKSPEFFAAFDVTIATDVDFVTYTSINAACRIANRRFYAAGIHGFYGYAFADLISHDFVIEREKSNVASQQQETLTRSIVDITTKRENDRVIELVTKREVYSPLLLANSSPLPEEFTRVARRKRQVTPLLSCLRALWEFQRTYDGKLPSFSRSDLELFTRLVNERHRELQLDINIIDSVFLRSFLENLGCELSPVAAFLGGNLAQDVINVLSAREQPLQNLLLFDGERNVAPIYPLHPIFSPRIENMAASNVQTALPVITSVPQGTVVGL
ncbi:putative SUMO activating enzyme [Talaromyces proteolyticus]|uniref:Ubiquitin-like 1-activating enzyme E1A n=1 Tax=Talaromyces proteolyticus TaxID=1131652 RepID=A0AAD4KWR7_9EURO|nr:putative SUMO activating enzyme [Talaromyces proteolyticus]KAH8702582.1 putative SUMO activating enzyme [Talaromyces proteolyticus]